uniref:Uncharacterized protein n=1 Tax=Anguilla anguilla TaxID=7936 RepID=A0A0E9XTC5_ANGAN
MSVCKCECYMLLGKCPHGDNEVCYIYVCVCVYVCMLQSVFIVCCKYTRVTWNFCTLKTFFFFNVNLALTSQYRDTATTDQKKKSQFIQPIYEQLFAV